MRWFEGSIPDAINLAKLRSFVFVVVITGEDEQSAQLMSSWEEDKVSEAAHNCCVAIKVDAKRCMLIRLEVGQFYQKQVLLLRPVHLTVQWQNLLHLQPQLEQFLLGQQQEPQPQSLQQLQEQQKVASLSNTVDDGSLSGTVTENASSDYAAQCAHSEENLDAKVERLTKKLEERREQRKTGEEENDIKKEMERRKVGKDMQDFKRKQEEEKTKRLLEERNREKAEEKAARERVKQQIALDRADRAARYAKTQEEEKAAKQAQLQARLAEQEARKEALLRERSTVARIQFRLPDGSSFTNHFSSQSRLQEARNFAVQEVGNRYGSFSLATMFPRREFTNEDLNRTLLELQLTPSASIVLLPVRPPFISHFTELESLSKHTLEKRPKDFKKDGKICRLRTQEDSEDDNNTWNGNSTQQM
ncbi:hypothetical protein L3Q82_004494 [Scortum barcoo]|uniref:Uncharacterized protein n=1 Tax=Scortum barcoo TaxID=214431 RepID=A0ACB8VL02_9TELE|nr:hypothetical protein L3Q82_004494 [Scortum barcoo]